VITVLEGNGKIRLRQATDQVPYYDSVSFELRTKVAEETDLEMCSYGQ